MHRKKKGPIILHSFDSFPRLISESILVFQCQYELYNNDFYLILEHTVVRDFEIAKWAKSEKVDHITGDILDFC